MLLLQRIWVGLPPHTPSMTPVQGTSEGTHMTHIHACRPNTHTHKINKNKVPIKKFSKQITTIQRVDTWLCGYVSLLHLGLRLSLTLQTNQDKKIHKNVIPVFLNFSSIPFFFLIERMKIRNFLTKALKLFAFKQVNADLSSNVNSFGEE